MSPRLPPLADVLDLVPDAVCVVDPEGRFLFVSASFERIFGYAPAEVLGRTTFELVHPEDRAETMAQAAEVMNGTLQRHFRNRYIHKDGRTVDVQWSARWLPEHGVRIAVGHEVTELRRAERELERLAGQDALTGLPNLVARVGGDEFVVLLPGCRDHDTAATVADGLRELLHRAYAMPEGLHRLEASIGIACHPADGDDGEALLVHADRAMYAAKHATGRVPRR